MSRLYDPPNREPLAGPDGRPTETWQNWFNAAKTGVATDAAPADARYLILTANSDLTQATNLGLLTAGWLRITTALGVTSIFSSKPVISQSSPADPVGTVSAVGVMMGLGGSITPAVTGRIHVTVSGTIFNPTAIADGAKVQIRVGTGAAPGNGAALSGTAAGGLVQYVAATVAEKAPFALCAFVSGLAVGTAVWIDLGLAAITGGTATVSDLSIAAFEL